MSSPWSPHDDPMTYWTYFVASMEAKFDFHGSSWKLMEAPWKLVEVGGSLWKQQWKPLLYTEQLPWWLP